MPPEYDRRQRAGLTSRVEVLESATSVSVDTAQTITGVKTFTANPVFQDAAIPQAKVVGLVADLVARYTKAESDGRFWPLTTDLFTQAEFVASDAGVVHLAGAETITGVKTYTADPVFNDAAIPQAKVVGLAGDYVTLTTAQTITGLKTVMPSASTAVAFIIQGLASQAGDLLQLRNSAGVVQSKVGPTGNVLVGSANPSNATLAIGTAAPSPIGGMYATLDIRGSVGAGIRLGKSASPHSTIYDTAGLLRIATTSAQPILFEIADVEKFRVGADGLVSAFFAATAAIRTLELGALDSAGAGFRTVRTAN